MKTQITLTPAPEGVHDPIYGVVAFLIFAALVAFACYYFHKQCRKNEVSN